MPKTEESLERLVSSGRCSCLNAGEYTAQLRRMAIEEADRDEARRRGRFFKALGDETRQRILGLLSAREMCVCEIISALEMTQPTTSHHLKILEDAGLLDSRKEGKWVIYSLRDRQLVSELHQLAKE